MAINRRDTFKLVGAAAIAAVIPKVAIASDETSVSAKVASGKSVVIIGGGFGGLTMAKALKKQDKSIEVVVIEKNNIFMACPFSNALLGGLDGVVFDTFIADYYQPAATYDYDFIHATVTAIDRKAKTVTTTNGVFAYNILVLSPGIAYDYEKQFPAWSQEKIAHISQACPAALIPGNEHIALKRQLNNMGDGNVIIIPPAKGKYRCPPAPYERAVMVANYMKNKGIKGKVIVLDTRGGKFAKGEAFKESWNDLFPDIIEYKGFTEVVDIDPVVQTITYIDFANADDAKGVTKIETYQVCNLIPLNKCSPVVAMAGVEVNSEGYAVMDGYGFKTKTDSNIYVVGDAVTHEIPASGQTAIWAANRAAGEIIAQFNSKVYDTREGLPAKSASICFSMVGGKPEEAIMMTHTFLADESGIIKSEGEVLLPKDGNGKFRSKSVAKDTREWFSGVMRELFS